MQNDTDVISPKCWRWMLSSEGCESRGNPLDLRVSRLEAPLCWVSCNRAVAELQNDSSVQKYLWSRDTLSDSQNQEFPSRSFFHSAKILLRIYPTQDVVRGPGNHQWSSTDPGSAVSFWYRFCGVYRNNHRANQNVIRVRIHISGNLEKGVTTSEENQGSVHGKMALLAGPGSAGEAI